MTRVTLPEAEKRLRELLVAACDGQEIVIASPDGRNIRLVPTGRPARSRGGWGALKGKIQMADDFDAPLDDFKE